jgi:toxin FitB
VGYVILDTDVSSRSIKRQLRQPLAARLNGMTWCVTFVTVGELWQWAWTGRWGRQSRADLERWLDRVIVLDSDEEVCRTWGRISAEANLRGLPRPVNDSWIAACCLARGLPLATLNVKDFADFVDHEGLVLVQE